MSLYNCNFFISSDGAWPFLDGSFLRYRFSWYFYPCIFSPTYILNFKPLVETTTLTFFLFINIGSISEADIPHNIVALLKSKAKGHQNLNSIPDKLSATLSGHTRAVNAIQWSSTHGKFSKFTSCCPCLWYGLLLGNNSFLILFLNGESIVLYIFAWSKYLFTTRVNTKLKYFKSITHSHK